MMAGFTMTLSALALLVSASIATAATPCLEPIEPLSFRLDRTDPLYPAALDEHRRYLEEMEDYVNCFDRERFVALSMLRESFGRFNEFFGADANFEYDPDGGTVEAAPDAD